MKLKFKNQDFQTDAVNTICDLFAGQEKTSTNDHVAMSNAYYILRDRNIEMKLL